MERREALSLAFAFAFASIYIIPFSTIALGVPMKMKPATTNTTDQPTRRNFFGAAAAVAVAPIAAVAPTAIAAPSSTTTATATAKCLFRLSQSFVAHARSCLHLCKTAREQACDCKSCKRLVALTNQVERIAADVRASFGEWEDEAYECAHRLEPLDKSGVSERGNEQAVERALLGVWVIMHARDDLTAAHGDECECYACQDLANWGGVLPYLYGSLIGDLYDISGLEEVFEQRFGAKPYGA